MNEERDGVVGFEAFRCSMHREVLALVFARSNSRLAAEELLQEVFVAARSSWSGDVETSTRLVRSLALTRAGSRSRVWRARTRAMLSGSWRRGRLPGPLDADADAYWHAVSTLPALLADTIALRSVSDLADGAIAAVLDVDVDAIEHARRSGDSSLATVFDPDRAIEVRLEDDGR